MATQSRFTTITDIAKKVGVSPSVVSFVLNGSSGKAKRYCSDELRKKIMATAKELNYIQSNVASNLKGRPRNLMAVLIPQFFNEFFTQMALEIEVELEKAGYILSICNTFDDPNCCRSYEGPLNEETGYELTKQALIENPNLQAIVFANNIHARLGVKCLIEKGLEPGRDISVAIVGAPKWVQTGLNNFTCVDLNGRGIGKRAAHIMLSIIKNELPENKFMHEYIPCTLNVGNSIIKK